MSVDGIHCFELQGTSFACRQSETARRQFSEFGDEFGKIDSSMRAGRPHASSSRSRQQAALLLSLVALDRNRAILDPFSLARASRAALAQICARRGYGTVHGTRPYTELWYRVCTVRYREIDSCTPYTCTRARKKARREVAEAHRKVQRTLLLL